MADQTSRSQLGFYNRSTLGVRGRKLVSTCPCSADGATMFPLTITATLAGITVPTGICYCESAGEPFATFVNSCNLNGGRSVSLAFQFSFDNICVYSAIDDGSDYLLGIDPTSGLCTSAYPGTKFQWLVYLTWLSGTGAKVAMHAPTQPAVSITSYGVDPDASYGIEPFFSDPSDNPLLVCGGSVMLNNTSFISSPPCNAPRSISAYYGGAITLSA